MKRISQSCLWVILSFCAAGAQAEDAVCTPFTRHAKEQRLCVENRGMQESRWFVKINPGKIREIAPPAVAMHYVSELKAAPSGDFLAVVSVGEGHPILELFSLPAVLEGFAQEALLEINPYPGSVSLEYWENGKLVIASDSELPQYPADSSGQTMLRPLDKNHLFVIEPGKAEIKPYQPDKERN